MDDIIDAVKSARIVMVVGKNDTGKSTLIKKISVDMPVSIVDSDIGQSDIGPPSVVSLGEKAKDGYYMADGYFCGSTTPAGHLLPMVAGVSRMVRLAAKKPILVNTTGLATGNIGIVLKSQKIGAISPDLIIGLERGSELGYLEAFRHEGIRVEFFSVSKDVREKSKVERANLRKESFQAHFKDASFQTVYLDDIGVERSLLCNGETVDVDMPGIMHVESGDNEALVIFEDRISAPGDIMQRVGVKTLYGYKLKNFKGLLLGMTDPAGKLKGLGIVESIDLKNMEMSVFTPARSFTCIQFGSIRIDRETYEYLGPFQPVTYGASFAR